MSLGGPFAILQAIMQRPREVSLRTKMKVTSADIERHPSCSCIFFFRSLAFFFHHVSKLLILLPFSIMCISWYKERGAGPAIVVRLRSDTYRRGENTNCQGTTARRLQEEDKSKCTADRRWLQTLWVNVFQVHFLDNSWLKEKSFHQCLLKILKVQHITGLHPW